MDTVAQLEHWKGLLTPGLYGFAVLAMIAETVYFARNKVPRDSRSRWLGIRCGALAFGLGAAFHAVITIGAQAWVYEHRLFDLGFGWQAWVLCFVVNDLMFYVSHRAQHEIRALWAIHVVHHSSRHYDLTAGVRGSVFDAAFHFPFYVWIPLLGIHPLIVVILETAFRFYGLAYHTELVGKLGPLDGVLVTPSNHRVHHGTEPHYIDKNYGGFFILWDRLFRTYQREDVRPTYGLTKRWHSYSTIDAQFHEWRDLWRDVKAAPTSSQALAHLLKPPGWRPEG